MNYSLTGTIVPIGNLYGGGCEAGDRVASAAEIAAWEAALLPTFASLKAAETARWMAIREPYFGRLASISVRLAKAGDTAGADSCTAVANSLLGLFTDSAVTSATEITAYKNALKNRYAQAVMLATPSAAAEFGKYDK